MRRLPRPQISAQHALTQCAQSIQDANLTARLEQVMPTVVAAEGAYVVHGDASTLHLIPSTNGIDGIVTTAEMKRVYNRTFVASARTRELYGALKSAPENGICPLCSQRTVSQLDHHLPQSAHPALTVTPVNLVPACSECNKTKLAIVAGNQGEQTFHPYFEDADDARWLFATVQETNPAALVFRPEPPAHWDALKSQRIAWHFQTYKLGELYASHAAVELNDIKFGLQEMAKLNTPRAISEHLRSQATSRAAAHKNSWRRASYEALADSVWFCSGGFA
jgi:5-methylcytosine-specific restriction endonuclease McrA